MKIFRKWLEKNRKEIKAEQYRSIVKQTMLLAAAQMEAARGLMEVFLHVGMGMGFAKNRKRVNLDGWFPTTSLEVVYRM